MVRDWRNEAAAHHPAASFRLVRSDASDGLLPSYLPPIPIYRPTEKEAGRWVPSSLARSGLGPLLML